MAQIEVRSKLTGKIRFISERNLEANRDKFEVVTGENIQPEALQYTPESESIKKKAARGVAENKPKKQKDADNTDSPE